MSKKTVIQGGNFKIKRYGDTGSVKGTCKKCGRVFSARRDSRCIEFEQCSRCIIPFPG